MSRRPVTGHGPIRAGIQDTAGRQMSTRTTLRISHYRVEHELARDALGYVFRAIDEQLDRPVVLRVARAGLVRSDAELVALRKNIRDHARAAGQISHPNLVTIYEFRSLAETDLVVMELVEGDTPQAMRQAGHRWTVLDVARLLARIADAMAAAHAAGLVHGDIRAHNIRIRQDGRVKLLDLGIPKVRLLDDANTPEPQDDVRGLAQVACDLLVAPPPDDLPEGLARRDPLADPVLGRAQFGFLAPVLTQALRDPKGFANAAPFRDAILLALDMATGRSAPGRGELEGAFATHLAGPERPRAAEDVLPADGRTLAQMGRAGGRMGPRLLLPPDLAGRTTDYDDAHLPEVRPAPHGRGGGIDRMVDRFLGAPVAAAAVVVVALTIVGLLVWRRYAPAEVVTRSASTATVPESVQAAASTLTEAPTNPMDVATAAGDSMVGQPPVDSDGAGPRPLFTAWVRALPRGTNIRVVGRDEAWRDTVELSVPSGDTLMIRFARAGYVPQILPFTGSRIATTLTPDSVVARFDANITATVFAGDPGDEARLGTTPLATRLPTGTHRIVFRAAGQPDWESSQPMPQPGSSYTVSKVDYLTHGSLVVTVSGSWAMVTVGGGPPRETPARFDSLSAGPHVVRIARDGFQTETDTVVVQAGQTTRRPYTLRR